MKPFFSIIIPTLNEEHFLPHLLKDLQKQKDKNFEIVIADGNSEDRTKEVALAYKNLLSLSFFINEKKNVAYQRNFAAREAKGKYLIFIDADSRVSSAFTKILRKEIDRKKGLIFLPYNLPSENDTQTKLLFRFVNFLVELSQTTRKPFSTMGMIWEKNFFYTIGGFDEKVYIAEDHKIIQDAHLWGVKAKFLNKVRVTFSLRRMKTEGQWSLLYKYLVATSHILLKGDIKKKIFKYEMGGGIERKDKTNLNFKQNFKYYLKELKQFFEQ